MLAYAHSQEWLCHSILGWLLCLALRALIIFQLLRESENIPQRQGRPKLADVYSRDKKPPCAGSTEKKLMMMDWNEYQKQIGATLGELMKLSPDTVRAYQTLSAANSKTGKLDEKTRQLISLACAVTTRCDGCIVVHSEAALKAGATKDEIAEALGVAVAMNAGAALIYSTRVLDAVNAKSGQVRTA